MDALDASIPAWNGSIFEVRRFSQSAAEAISRFWRSSGRAVVTG